MALQPVNSDFDLMVVSIIVILLFSIQTSTPVTMRPRSLNGSASFGFGPRRLPTNHHVFLAVKFRLGSKSLETVRCEQRLLKSANRTSPESASGPMRSKKCPILPRMQPLLIGDIRYPLGLTSLHWCRCRKIFSVSAPPHPTAPSARHRARNTQP